MTYRGQIKNGVVVLEGNPPLPEGTQVRVEAVQTPAETPLQTPETPNVWDGLLELAGTAEGLPPDASQNIDYYLYGLPKR